MPIIIIRTFHCINAKPNRNKYDLELRNENTSCGDTSKIARLPIALTYMCWKYSSPNRKLRANRNERTDGRTNGASRAKPSRTEPSRTEIKFTKQGVLPY